MKHLKNLQSKEINLYKIFLVADVACQIVTQFKKRIFKGKESLIIVTYHQSNDTLLHYFKHRKKSEAEIVENES